MFRQHNAFIQDPSKGMHCLLALAAWLLTDMLILVALIGLIAEGVDAWMLETRGTPVTSRACRTNTHVLHEHALESIGN